MRYHLCTILPHGKNLSECKHSYALSGAPVIAYTDILYPSVCRSESYSADCLSPFQHTGALCADQSSLLVFFIALTLLIILYLLFSVKSKNKVMLYSFRRRPSVLRHLPGLLRLFYLHREVLQAQVFGLPSQVVIRRCRFFRYVPLF